MDKTLHKKLTEKHLYNHMPAVAYVSGEGTLFCSSNSLRVGFEQELMMLQEAAKDLLQPRPQAIAKLLQMAREI